MLRNVLHLRGQNNLVNIAKRHIFIGEITNLRFGQMREKEWWKLKK